MRRTLRTGLSTDMSFNVDYCHSLCTKCSFCYTINTLPGVINPAGDNSGG